MGVGVVSHVAVVSHFKALAFCLSYWPSRNEQIILEIAKQNLEGSVKIVE